MDNSTRRFIGVTRQFLALTRKLKTELRKSLSDLNSALHKQTEAMRKSYQVSNDKRGAPPKVTVLNNLPSSIEVHQNEKDTKDERNYKRAMFFVTSLTLGAIVVYAYLVTLQYREMIRSTEAAQAAAVAALSAAATAKKTFESSQQQFRNEQRPFLSPQPRPGFSNGSFVALGREHNPPETSDWLFSAAVDLANVGRSPAAEVLVTNTEYMVRPKDQARRDASHFVPKYKSTPHIVMAGTTITPTSETKGLTQTEFNAFNDGTWEIYIVGAATYIDIFDPRELSPYGSTFCFRIMPKGMTVGHCEWRAPLFHASIK